jgi:Calcineurin-like phosphoesterase
VLEAIDVLHNKMVGVPFLVALAAIPAFALAQAAPPQSQSGVVVAVAGDIAGPWSGDTATGDIIRADASIDHVLTTGDNVYDSGTSSEFAEFYDEAWGDFKDKTLPVPGNHDWKSGATGYKEYFGKPTHYVTDAGAWRLIALDSERCDSSTFLSDALSSAGNRHVLAYWHHPLLNVGTEWVGMLETAEAELVLTGHDHSYQRFAPVNGVRHFVAGAGGKLGDGISSNDSDEAHLEKAIANELGVLRLELDADSYSWSFVTPSGVQDSGTQTVGGAPAPGPTPTPAPTSTPDPDTSPDETPGSDESPAPEESPLPDESPAPDETGLPGPMPSPDETAPPTVDVCYIFSTYVVEHPDGTSEVIESPRQEVPCAALGSRSSPDASLEPLPTAAPGVAQESCEPRSDEEGAGDAAQTSSAEAPGCGVAPGAAETSSQRITRESAGADSNDEEDD